MSYFVLYCYLSICKLSGTDKLITSVGEKRTIFSAIVYLLLCGFCLDGFPLPLGAWHRLPYSIMTLPVPSI